MATTSPDNLYSPDSSDPYALTQDLGAMQDSVQTALVRRANAYVGTSAQRNAFTTAPVGTIWSDTNGSRLVYKRGASSWEPIYSIEDTGWVNITPASGYTGTSLAVRRIGNVVYLRGSVAKTSGGFENTLGTTIFTIPAGMRPSVYFRAPVVSYNGGGAGTFYLAIVESTGSVSVGRMGSGTGADLYLGGLMWVV